MCVRVMREARLVRRHHKHSSNDPANFPTNSQTDKFLQLLPVAPPLLVTLKTHFTASFFEGTKNIFCDKYSEKCKYSQGWGHPSSHPGSGPADVIRDNNSWPRPPPV